MVVNEYNEATETPWAAKKIVALQFMTRNIMSVSEPSHNKKIDINSKFLFYSVLMTY